MLILKTVRNNEGTGIKKNNRNEEREKVENKVVLDGCLIKMEWL